jgi:di/tricarboxylate transporter
MFLTSKSVNLAVFSMFPQQIQDQFQWLSWLFAATATGAVMFILFFIASAFFYRNQEPTRISGEQINQQLALLGKLKLREWAALSGIVIFILGIITYSLHKIQPPWLGMAILYWLLLFGFLHKQEFKEQIDWPFLFYLASIVGIIAILNSVGLDKLIAKQLIPVGEYMRTNFELFILILSVIILLVRLVMPINATIVLLAAIFIPLSDVAGVNAWVIAFIILVLGEIWIFPYQCSYYLQFQEATGKYGIYDEKSFLRFNMLLSIIKLVALYASIPYWKMLSIL